MDARGHGGDIDAFDASVVHHVAVLGVLDDQIDFEVFEGSFFDGLAFDLCFTAGGFHGVPIAVERFRLVACGAHRLGCDLNRFISDADDLRLFVH